MAIRPAWPSISRFAWWRAPPRSTLPRASRPDAENPSSETDMCKISRRRGSTLTQSPSRGAGVHTSSIAQLAASRERIATGLAAVLSSDAYAHAADKPEGTDTHDLGAGGGLGPALDVLAAQQHEPAHDDADVGRDDERDAAEQGSLEDVELRAGELGLGQVEVHAAEQTDVEETARQAQPAGEPDTSEERD